MSKQIGASIAESFVKIEHEKDERINEDLISKDLLNKEGLLIQGTQDASYCQPPNSQPEERDIPNLKDKGIEQSIVMKRTRGGMRSFLGEIQANERLSERKVRQDQGTIYLGSGQYNVSIGHPIDQEQDHLVSLGQIETMDCIPLHSHGSDEGQSSNKKSEITKTSVERVNDQRSRYCNVKKNMYVIAPKSLEGLHHNSFRLSNNLNRRVSCTSQSDPETEQVQEQKRSSFLQEASKPRRTLAYNDDTRVYQNKIQSFSPAIIQMIIKDSMPLNEAKTTALAPHAEVFSNEGSSSFSSGTYGSDPSIVEHRKTVEILVEQQKKLFQLWFKQDHHLIFFGKSLFKQDFTQETPILKQSFWEQAHFTCSSITDTFLPHIEKDTWVDDILGTSKKGLHLKQTILTPRCHFDLRFYALRLTLSLRLYGNSSFWVFTRLQGKRLEAFAPIIGIRKIQGAQRIFAIMGSLKSEKLEFNTNNHLSHTFSPQSSDDNGSLQFKYYKSQEIPNFCYDSRTKRFASTPSQNQLQKDYLDLTLSIVDNGDDRVCVEIPIGEGRQINLVCDMFIPIVDLEESSGTQVMLGAAGCTTIIREIKAKQIQRQETFKSGIIIENESRCYQNCCCATF